MALIDEVEGVMNAVQTPTAPWYVGGGTRTTASTRHDAQRFCREIVSSDIYRKGLKERADKGDLAPALEAMLWAYAYGKPVEQVRMTIETEEDLSELSIEELEARTLEMQEMLKEAKDLEQAIPAQYFVTQTP